MDAQKSLVLKVTDFVEPNLDREKKECEDCGVSFLEYQLQDASPAEIISKCGDADFLFVDQARITKDVMFGLTKVKVIVRHGDGYEKLDLDAATEMGIICVNQPGVWSEEVAEHACSLLFSTFKKLKVQQNMVNQSANKGCWDRSLSGIMRMRGKVLGIVGVGKIGSFVAQKMKAFGLRVIACDKYRSKEELQLLGVESVTFDELLTTSDLITIHVPLNSETKCLFGAREFALMKSTSILVNTARGPIIEKSALLRALSENRLAGVGLDVYPDDQEPPPKDSPLLTHDNVVLTPHLAWYSEEALDLMRERNMEQFRRFLKNELPCNILNPKVLGTDQCRMKYAKSC